jgi:predicted nucleic acid-binding protein
VTRVVVDASVLVSAAVGFPDSPSARVLDAVRTGRLELVVCELLLGELDRALQTHYFAKRVTSPERASTGLLLRTLAVVSPILLIRRPSFATQRTTTSWSSRAGPVPRRSSPATRICWSTPG